MNIVNKIYEFLNNLSGRNQKLFMAIPTGLASGFLLAAKPDLLSVAVVSAGFIILIFSKNIKKSEMIAPILLVTLSFRIMISADNPISSAFFITAIVVFIKIYVKGLKHKIKMESVIVIILTVVLLQISYPVFEPRVEILEVGEVYHGFVFNETPYGLQDYTLSVLPPLISTSCADIILGFDVINVETPDYRYGTRVLLNDGVTYFCTPVFDFTKRVVKLTVNSRQPIDFEITSKDITRFWWIEADNNRTRTANTEFFNKASVPIKFDGNVTYIINNRTMLDHEINLWDFLNNDTSKLHCRLENFKFSHSKNGFDYDNNYTVDEDKATLTFYITDYLLPGNYTANYIKFQPDACDS